MQKPKTLILRTAGTNCDKETKFAFELAGASADLVHINQIIRKEKSLSDYAILALPGGFSYGDDVAAGKILANELVFRLKDELVKFLKAGKLIIGICNGFQVLVKSGILSTDSVSFRQDFSLINNDCGKFEDRWTYLRIADYGSGVRKCVWTKNLQEMIHLPVAHGEGKFIAKDKKILENLKENGQVVFQYCNHQGKFTGYPDNPNGSVDNVAGICDNSGRVFGLMPHPERHILGTHHPRWMREGLKKEGDGLAIFRNGVEYAKKNL
ncbi:MAG: phosphoribosylformylglycinamidine synthase I [Candidatus Omnitrophica bacterium CG11_big_fil_rev_8_21_14_0_20_42_13]|uniref:Phosphoribosylformylglycinamidine synthase subunit PurQ n=1 Tax=Candidatus Ghiorseimicrobium undicola TaxID=1974746 RepID=A0A2H0LZG5_9BACT|nr:MAG: phosphoribosylformylglycinamidine synthase I [Candidatus Omnitrophica bacterium CG11_big_fil_rev_8_21_14_0_20_42_13]